MEELAIEKTSTVNAKNETDIGYMRLHTVDIQSDFPGNAGEDIWSGIYFSAIPITIEAVAKEEYEFSHWDGLDSQEEKPK